MTSRATRLVLVRHGHTAANGGRGAMTMSGWTDTPLSDLGRLEARLLRDRLLLGPPLAAIYASPLSRARETAVGLDGDTVPLVLDEDLREIGCGLVDGLPVDAVRALYPPLWERNLRQDDDAFRWPEGESYLEFRERCLRAIQRIAARHPGSRVAVVTHAGVVSQVVGAIHGLPPARWEPYRPGNASVTVVDWEGDAGRLVSFDDRCHLELPAHAG